MNKDTQVLRQLASQYAELAFSDKNQEKIVLQKKVNDLKPSRPFVLIDEIPWHEMNVNDELTLQCSNEKLREIEYYFRTNLYRMHHFPADQALIPYYKLRKVVHSTGIGLVKKFEENQQPDVQAHIYIDQLNTEEDLEKLHNEVISYDEAATMAEYELLSNIFGDILPVKIKGHETGYDLGATTWDDIVFYRGLDNLFYDLIERPEFMHKLASKMTDIFLDKMRQFEELDLLDNDAYTNHSASALTDDLHPTETNVKMKDLWGRGIAQIFASVSPAMHDEFDITYMLKAMEPFGLIYYGCCEPLDKKIDILEKIPNLRKISITPWADIEVAAEQMQNKYVVSAKPNPSQIAVPVLDKEAVRKELTHITEACYKNGCSCEIVLKDITTSCGRPENLSEWEQIAMEIVGGY